MIKTAAALALVVVISFAARAQTDTLSKHKIFYWSTYAPGILFGNSAKDPAFTFSTTQGIRMGRLTTGLGAGIDVHEHWRFVPLFASVGFDVVRLGNSTLYVQANGGYSLATYSNSNDGAPSYDASGGPMLNPMAGWRLSLGKHSLYLAGGYKWQRNDYKDTSFYPWSYPGPETSIQEDTRRVVFAIGFGLH